ncbi:MULTISPECIES: PepSY domain-containing protein [unclassified Corynebacterium]|uniref:PepSY domain-containing protein n=1 Tax=unclassified Corynebacterium TaxID=2624378 RepID=UPI0029CA40D4|nr:MULTISPECIES: hypothetical protein [unclassified Corynebacterium]WPF65955.1 hypothetical protein OLX12_10435 [Corynebacterium sp. 22KM0430]WPF68448.1 hypothetical protein OLW90_10430 [Corynebacterium sp. 21KM1197]
MNRRLALIPTAALTLTLVACSSDDDNPITTEIVTVTEEAPAASSAAATAAASDSDDDDTKAGAVSTDGALAAIQDALAAHPDGIITDLDRDRDSYEIDLVVGQEHLELTVDAKGNVTEVERESEDDAEDIAEAQAATVTAADAAQQALDQHPDAVIDSLSLDEEDGRLEWDIDLDDAQGNDLAEMKIPAV